MEFKKEIFKKDIEKDYVGFHFKISPELAKFMAEKSNSLDITQKSYITQLIQAAKDGII